MYMQNNLGILIINHHECAWGKVQFKFLTFCIGRSGTGVKGHQMVVVVLELLHQQVGVALEAPGWTEGAPWRRNPSSCEKNKNAWEIEAT